MLSQDKPKNATEMKGNYEVMGYDSPNLTDNLGLVFILIAFLVVFAILLLAIRVIVKKFPL